MKIGTAVGVREKENPPNEREPTTPIYSEDENDESKSESFGDVSSEGSACALHRRNQRTHNKKKEVTKETTCKIKNFVSLGSNWNPPPGLLIVSPEVLGQF